MRRCRDLSPPGTRYQIARRVVGAEIQYITYTEFLPTSGIRLLSYRGYRASVDPSLGNEFATVGFRAHSMVHGEFEPSFPEGRFTQAQLDAFEARGIEVEHVDGTVVLVISLSIAFGNPELLLETVGLGPFLASLAEVQYKNDEQIDNTLRSVLFHVLGPGVDPAACGPEVVNSECFAGVVDLGAVRTSCAPATTASRHTTRYAVPSGSNPRLPFTAITGESTDLLGGRSIDDPAILDFVELHASDVLDELSLNPDAPVATSGVRRTTLAARLRAVFGSVDRIDAFTGMLSEKHVAGSEFGPLQAAIWKEQFTALRDGDRFFLQHGP